MEAFKDVIQPSNFCLLLGACGAAASLRPASRCLGRRMIGSAIVVLLVLPSG